MEAIAVRIQERDDPESKDAEVLAAQIEFVKDRVNDLQGQIHETDQLMESVPGYSGELDARTQELEGLELTAKELKQKIGALELALQAPCACRLSIRPKQCRRSRRYTAAGSKCPRRDRIPCRGFRSCG